MHDEDASAVGFQTAQGAGDALMERVAQIVVPRPVFEQIAQDVERLGLGRDIGGEAQEQLRAVRMRGAQVQVGDEEGMRHEIKTAPKRRLLLLHHFRLGDDDVLVRHVLVEAAAAGLHLGDGVDHFLAFDHLAEHAVAPAVRCPRVVEEARCPSVLMKNCAVAECGSLVRAMAMV